MFTRTHYILPRRAHVRTPCANVRRPLSAFILVVFLINYHDVITRNEYHTVHSGRVYCLRNAHAFFSFWEQPCDAPPPPLQSSRRQPGRITYALPTASLPRCKYKVSLCLPLYAARISREAVFGTSPSPCCPGYSAPRNWVYIRNPPWNKFFRFVHSTFFFRRLDATIEERRTWITTGRRSRPWQTAVPTRSLKTNNVGRKFVIVAIATSPMSNNLINNNTSVTLSRSKAATAHVSDTGSEEPARVVIKLYQPKKY